MPRPSRSAPPKYTARTADKHELYQMSVQDPPTEVAFIERVFKKAYGRRPLVLREDFCGTALFCADWVKSHAERRAIGIDLDRPTLDWGLERNVAPLGEAASRVQLLQQDVRDPISERVDVAIGLNFSYWVFKTRAEMVAYFKGVRASLRQEGLFVLDAYGGPLSMEAMDEADLERTKVKGGFTYVWHQASFNAIDHSVVNHIHFEFKDGTALNKAFTYNWRFWTLPEIQEMVLEAGFSSSQIFWEDEDEDGEGTGVYRARKRAESTGAWVAYIIAQ
jgi:SAM-dependent methyltransferase